MRRISVSRLLSTAGMLATGMLAGSAFAAPQYASPYGNDPGYRDGQVVRCESSDGRGRECPIDSHGRVRLLRQLSGAPCIEGRTWGSGSGRIWVSEGCRGEFAASGDDEYADDYGNTGQLVRCESSDGRWRLCAMDTRGDIQLVRQLSDSACIEGRSWGRDRAGVWVSQGCRAEFGSIGYSAGAGVGQSIRCESDDGRYRQCSADVRGGVRLLRQLSDARCIEGRTWGVNRAGVWVDEGCRAEFETGYRGNNGWGLGQYRNNPYRNNQYRSNDRYGSSHGYTGRTLRCESKDGRTNRCNAAIRGARLQRQLSGTRCLQGSNWGWDRGGVWVSGGCRAEFLIW